ncbi:MAG: FliH/SctL family protein [Chloroflexi bacterium]|nr:FliH/SctL family protein [Chloroflexota bacterium]
MALYKGGKYDNPSDDGMNRRLHRTSLIKGDSMELDIESVEETSEVSEYDENPFYPDILLETVDVPTRDPEAPIRMPGIMDEVTEGVEPPPRAEPRKSPEEIENEAREKANRIITEAQTEAGRLQEENKRQCRKAIEDANQEGYEAGYEAGDKAGREAYVSLMEEAAELYDAAKEERLRVLSTVEPEVAELAVEIAERVINQEVKSDPNIVLNMVKEALGKIKDRDEITIRVNPDDLPIVEGAKESFTRFMQGIREYTISGDARIERGGCIIESNLGSVDSRLKTRIEAIKVAFDNTAREYADGNAAESNS